MTTTTTETEDCKLCEAPITDRASAERFIGHISHETHADPPYCRKCMVTGQAAHAEFLVNDEPMCGFHAAQRRGDVA